MKSNRCRGKLRLLRERLPCLTSGDVGKDITPNQKRGRCKSLVNKYTESTMLIPLSGPNSKPRIVVSLVDGDRQRGAKRSLYTWMNSERIVRLESGSIQGKPETSDTVYAVLMRRIAECQPRVRTSRQRDTP